MCRAEPLVDPASDKAFFPPALMIIGRAPNMIAWRNCHWYCLNGTSPDLSLWGWVGWKWTGGLNWLGNSLSDACLWCRDKVRASRQVMWPALIGSKNTPHLYCLLYKWGVSIWNCSVCTPSPMVLLPWWIYKRHRATFQIFMILCAIYQALGLTTSGIQPWISKVQLLVHRNVIV